MVEQSGAVNNCSEKAKKVSGGDGARNSETKDDGYDAARELSQDALGEDRS